jgi:hypothetical protein
LLLTSETERNNPLGGKEEEEERSKQEFGRWMFYAGELREAAGQRTKEGRKIEGVSGFLLCNEKRITCLKELALQLRLRAWLVNFWRAFEYLLSLLSILNKYIDCSLTYSMITRNMENRFKKPNRIVPEVPSGNPV